MLFMDESCNKKNSNYNMTGFTIRAWRLLIFRLGRKNCCSTVEKYNGKSFQFVNSPSTRTSLDFRASRKVISCFYYAIIVDVIIIIFRSIAINLR